MAARAPEASALHHAGSVLIRTVSAGTMQVPVSSASSAARNASNNSSAALLRQNTRVEDRDAVQNRLHEEMFNAIRRELRVLVPIFIIIFALIIVGSWVSLTLLGTALEATFHYWDVPCDQPLRWQAPVTLGLGLLAEDLYKRAARRTLTSSWGNDPFLQYAISCVVAVPSWLVLGWSIYIIRACRTCQETNPHLYSAVSNFVKVQVSLAILQNLLSMVLAIFAQRLLLLVPRLLSMLQRKKAGCRKYVEQSIPRVSPDSAELVDPEDGEVRDCCICFAPLVPTGDEILRLTCSHYYHKDCLLQWCDMHNDCPLCRQEIGPEDGPDDLEKQETPQPASASASSV